MLRTGSVSVAYVAPDAYMQIDSASVEALEIIQPLQVPHACSFSYRVPAAGGISYMRSHDGAQAVPTAGKSAMGAASLFRWLNHTHTKSGSRLLRANLLQPLTDVGTLSLRQVRGCALIREPVVPGTQQT